MKFGNHREQRSPTWPYFQFNSQYNCSAMRSVVDLLIQITVRDRTVNMQSCYEFVKITSRQIGHFSSLYGN